MALIDKAALRAESRRLDQTDDKDIVRHQLERLNAVWAAASSAVPYYRHIKDQLNLPDAFASLEEYAGRMPVLTKEIGRDPTLSASFSSPPAQWKRITGGTTSSPVQYPAWNSEMTATRLDAWIGRGWYGVTPDDKMFLYWGHSHLLGKGLQGKVNALIRGLKDRIQRYHRHSCYDVSREAVRDAARTLLRVRPQFVLAYAHSLDRLARYCPDMADELAALRLKCVIGSAEAFPKEDSAALVGRVFDCPVAMEYGSVETGLMAHTHPQGGYRTFWNNSLLEVEPDERGDMVVLVTSLYPRAHPLFRYRLGDTLAPQGIRTVDKVSVLAFEQVGGRSNLDVVLPDGTELHSEVVSHIVRDRASVAGYQFVCADTQVELLVLSEPPLSADDTGEIMSKAERVHPSLPRYLKITTVNRLHTSVAGKTPMVVHLSPPNH